MQLSIFIRITALLTLHLASGVLFAISQPHPHIADGEGHASAPFFKVLNAEQGTEAFPLKSIQVKATVSGIIANVVIEQVYTNSGEKPIEAQYIFPASTQAAVHGVEMHVGGRIIKAKIQEKEQAKATYEKAKTEQKTASLLEQHRPNVFQMNLANILPGEEVRVLLTYSEKLTPVERVYELVIPNVVGPRYTSPSEKPDNWVANPYLPEGTPSPASFGISVNLNTGLALQALSSPSHTPAIEYTNPSTATVRLNASTEHANKDFVLRYQLADKQVASGLLLHKDSAENFFLLNLQPPARVTPDQIPARDYYFIVDVSGSMHGFPLETAKELLTHLIQKLRPTDTFNIQFFSGGSRRLSQAPLAATAKNLQTAHAFIDAAGAGGGTELLPALTEALATASQDGQSRSFVLITDGYVNVEEHAFKLVRENLHKANLFTFGIGSSVNRWLIESLAHAGQGEPFIVLNRDEAPATAERFSQYISSPVLTDIQITYDGFTTEDVLPSSVPDIFADRPVEITGKWKGQPSGTITISGMAGSAPYRAVIKVAEEATKGLSNPALKPLWAHEKVSILRQEYMTSGGMRFESSSQLKQAIINIGLNYSLLTEFTSFVAVDETPKPVLANATPQTVTQPSPLPAGVSQHAVGSNSSAAIASSGAGTSSSVPEPGITLLLAIALIALLLFRERRVLV